MPKEAAIRAALRPMALAAAAAEHREARIVEEFWTPSSNERADLVVVGACLHAYEIKSAADTLLRLPRQVAAFGRIFDRCSAVVATTHAERAAELLPPWWGLLVVEPGSGAILPQRSAQANPSVDIDVVVRLLWRAEVVQALHAHGVQPDLRGGRSAMWSQLLNSMDPSSIRATVRHALGTREHWRGHQGRPRLSPALAAAR